MIPETSTTLLKDISGDVENARWPEFVSRYRTMMLTYLKSHFPALDADDIVQETLIALSKVLPRYRYAPEETGHFRNYLTGILHKKALKRCACDARYRALQTEYRNFMVSDRVSTADDDQVAWRNALLEIATRQLLESSGISDKSKQIFQRLTTDGQSPEDVAAAYGTSRNNVDKVKSRMIARLREIVRSLETAGNV